MKEVELEIGFEVIVHFDEKLNFEGPFGHGTLRADISSNSVKIYAPTNGYLPSGAVMHELLHAERLLINQVPRISLAEHIFHNPRLETSLTKADNAIEHLIIVPIEIRNHPERRPHWEAITKRLWINEIPKIKNGQDMKVWACLNWSFLRIVLPDSPSLQLARNWLSNNNILSNAEAFYENSKLTINDKSTFVAMFFSFFKYLPRDDAALEYLSSVEGSRFEKISVLTSINSTDKAP